MIEYLLMVVIGVTFIVGFSMALFKPIGDYVDSVNRTYVQCLLETGELPALKSEAQMNCPLPRFAAGQMEGGDSSAGGGGAGGGNTSNNPNASNRSDTEGAVGDSESSGGSSSAAKASNRKSSVIRNGMRSSGTSQAELGNRNQTTIPVDNFEEGNGYMNLSSNGSSARQAQRKSRQLALSGLMEYDRKKAERQEQKIVSKPVENESFTQTKNKKVTVKPPPEKPLEEEENAGGGFGFYFKIFFIIIILLFIFLLLGGQAFQLSKNWE